MNEFGRYIREQLEQSWQVVVAALPNEPGGNWCPLCGGFLIPHDEAACEAKLAAWTPRGLA